MKTYTPTLAALLLAALPASGMAQELKFQLTFESLDGTGASLASSASLSKEGEIPVLDLGTDDGYLVLGDKAASAMGALSDFTVTTFLYVPATTDISANGNFIFTFAYSDDIANVANGCLFFNAKDTRYAISRTNWTGESGVSLATPFPKGEWKHVAYTQKDGKGYIYLDGVQKKDGDVSITPKELADEAGSAYKYNFLGKACYKGDAYLKGAKYCDFRIYDGALSAQQINALKDEKLAQLNTELNKNLLQSAINNLVIPEKTKQDLSLPTADGNVAISWATSNDKVITTTGKITRPAAGQPDAKATLTATFSLGGTSLAKDYEVTVLAQLDTEGCIDYDLENIAIKGNIDNLYSDLILPTTTVEGSILTWKSSDTDYLSDNGRLNKIADKGQKKVVILTATAEKDGMKKSREIEVTIGQDEGYNTYLFAYFTGNSPAQEQICFALSTDGYTFTPLNNGNPVVASDTIAIKKCVRDPHILRGEDGNTFYMVVTDMKSNDGWSSNDGLVLMKSTDMISWTHSAIDFPTTWPSLYDRDDLTQVWAPQTIYDPEEGKYMVYYSIGKKSQSHYKIFYSYANEAFTELTEPKLLFDLGANTIDGDIVYSNGLYHLFYKTEGNGNGIQKATATSLKGPWTPGNRYLQQTTEAVEGSGVFKHINSDKWVLMYDCYNNGRYQFCVSDDLENFTFVCNTPMSGKFTPRHGTIMPITPEEAESLMAKWPSTAFTADPKGTRNQMVRTNFMEISTSAKTIYLPVRYGADLSSFDPMLYGFEGTEVSPAGEQDFTTGPVEYTFSRQGGSKAVYKVTAEIAVNPILPDFHADPEILFSRKTKKFYCYTTTDGVPGWGGTYYTCYSSPDLVEWTLEGTVLDLASPQVSWATGNAWAPAIDEKMIDGEFKFFYYFSGQPAAGGGKQIGVASASSPVGPFYDKGAPIITSSPTGGGQQIDVDVFTDPVSGKSYIYWGNGYMAGAELEADMMSLVPGTTTVMTPKGGSLSTYAFREAPYVFYRKGTYYFMWSVDDTGSPNYHVAYGTSDSPLGPITVAKDPIVLIQDASNKIYGPAHNSVMQIPNTDDWYIVYHRINKKYLNDNPGIHRETCIDRLYFNEDGTIKRVVPTHKGVDPVVASEINTGIESIAIEGSDAAVVVTRYFTISGMLAGSSIESMPAGIYIKQEVLSDGTTRSSKIMTR